MYDLEYLPVALRDMTEIIRYISTELNNPTAAENLGDELVAAIEGVRQFPYSSPSYIPIRVLKNDYRKIIVRNYLVFYWVDEENKLITIARVIYAKRNVSDLLE